MKLRPRVKAFLPFALLGGVLFVSLLGARFIEYSGNAIGDPQETLRKAVRNWDATRLRLALIAGADPNRALASSSNMVPLYEAAGLGNLKIAKILLRAGADPDGSGELIGRPLFNAALGQNQEMAGLLLRRGARYEVLDALLLGDTEFVERALIEDPKVLQDMSYRGSSLLSIVVIFGRLDTARYLLELGLDPATETDHREKTVLEYARTRGLQDFVDLFELYQSVSEPEIV